jgi:hypothetical protein
MCVKQMPLLARMIAGRVETLQAGLKPRLYRYANIAGGAEARLLPGVHEGCSFSP